MRLLEEHEHDFQEKLAALRQKLAIGDAQLEAGQGIDGETFMKDLIDG
jgi:antitoxin ParD1/3/4